MSVEFKMPDGIEVPILTAVVDPDSEKVGRYSGYLKEDSSCIAEAKSLRKLKKKLLYLWWVKNTVTARMRPKLKSV